jgi:hypothetical protein
MHADVIKYAAGARFRSATCACLVPAPRAVFASEPRPNSAPRPTAALSSAPVFTTGWRSGQVLVLRLNSVDRNCPSTTLSTQAGPKSSLSTQAGPKRSLGASGDPGSAAPCRRASATPRGMPVAARLVQAVGRACQAPTGRCGRFSWDKTVGSRRARSLSSAPPGLRARPALLRRSRVVSRRTSSRCRGPTQDRSLHREGVRQDADVRRGAACGARPEGGRDGGQAPNTV